MMRGVGVERTPLLRDSRSPSAVSPLSRHYGQPSATSHRNGYPGARTQSQRRSQVHPLHRKSMPSSSSRQFSSTAMTSSRQFSQTTSTTPPPPPQAGNPTSNQIWQMFVSLPYRMLCFASPICSPVCCLCCCFTCIRSSEYGVMQKFGKFERMLDPGMHFIKWPMEREAGRISLRIRQLDVHIETKTKDHVFIRVHVSIQYQTNSTHLFESFYSLQSPTRQLTTLTHDILRSTLPQLELDDVFSSQNSIALELDRYLNGNMNGYGYMIHHALICQIDPNDHVKHSMNEMQASKRMKEAMPHKAEAVRIEKVKDAEARAERSYLNGVGVARERRAIAHGMKEVMESVVSDDGESNTTISPKGVMDLLLLTQYFDVLSDLNGVRSGKNGAAAGGPDNESPSSSLFLTHMPETVSQLAATARKCFGSVTSDAVKVENLIEL